MQDEHPVPWTISQMEAAFEAINRPVSAKTLENWRAGNSRPLPRNLVSLADIVSGGDKRKRDLWLETLSRAAQNRDTFKDVTEKNASERQVRPETTGPADASKHSKQRLWLTTCAAVLASAGIAWFVTSAWHDRSQISNVVTEMRFCSETHFDKATKRCRIDEPVFPATTDMIYVSFEADPPYGTPFERRWYRDGVKFIERDGFFDQAWENWTWINQDDGLLPGDYVLRVIIDGRTATHGFTIAADSTPQSSP